MIIHSNKLDVNKFKKDFVTLYRGEDKEQVLDRIIELISESDGSISSFLRKVDSIEDEKIQKRCRHAAIAQMYNVGLDYRCGSCYVETSASGEVIMIQLLESTVILSKYGDIISKKGEIRTQPRLILDVDKFKKDFVTLYGDNVPRCIIPWIRHNDKKHVLDKIIELVNESDGSISSFLRKVDLIKDKKIQKCCRHAAIAQMYNVGLDYNKCSSCFVAPNQDGKAFIVQLPQSTAILSKYGNIIFNEGEIWTQCGLNYGTGFITRKITDGQKKWGFINNYGDRVLPWIFDNIKGHVGELDIYYGKLCFELFTYGNIDFVGKDKLQEIIDDYDWRAFNCISEDNIIFSLNEMPESERNKRHDPVNHDKLMEELRTALSPILVSKERLQDIVDSKKE